MRILTKHDDGQVSIMLTQEEIKVLDDIMCDVREDNIDLVRELLEDSRGCDDLEEAIGFAEDAVLTYKQVEFAREYANMWAEESEAE